MTTELPSIDKHDIAVEVPFLNSGNVKPLSERRQLNAEYSESSYNLVRR
jgi:hypothetical protein